MVAVTAPAPALVNIITAEEEMRKNKEKKEINSLAGELKKGAASPFLTLSCRNSPPD